MINITITNDTVDGLHVDLWALLNGHRATATNAPTETTAAPTKEKPVSGRTREKNKAEAAAEAKANISTGEERSDPAVDAQDAADEKAETAATKPVDLTHDDVKKMLGGYVQAYGMAAAQEDGVGFIGAPKISEIPNTQAALSAAVIGIAKAIETNPKKRDIAGDGLTPEKTAELKVIVTAALAVK